MFFNWDLKVRIMKVCKNVIPPPAKNLRDFIYEVDVLGMGLIESLSTFWQEINLTSSSEQSWSFLCLALAFCWIMTGNTCKISTFPCTGSLRTPCSSSWSHFACNSSRHDLLWRPDFERGWLWRFFNRKRFILSNGVIITFSQVIIKHCTISSVYFIQSL